MTPFLVIQAIVIGLAVIASLIYACRRLMPATSQRWQEAVANSLSAASQPAALRAIGKRLQPVAAAAGCGSGCGSCSTGCGSVSAAEEQPLQFRERSRE
jgi:bacterioferritin-associated ferredoxin